MSNLKEIICYLLFNSYCFIKYNNKIICVIKMYGLPDKHNYNLLSYKPFVNLRRYINIYNILLHSRLTLSDVKVDRSLYILESELNNLRTCIDE